MLKHGPSTTNTSFDEPTAGVDVEPKNLWKNVKELNKIGVTIILTTHYLFEAQEMCDRMQLLIRKFSSFRYYKKALDRIKIKNFI